MKKRKKKNSFGWRRQESLPTLKLTGILLLVSLIFGPGLPFGLAAQSKGNLDRRITTTDDPDSISKALQTRVANFEKKYQVKMVLEDPGLPVPLAGQNIFGKPASAKEVERYLPMLLDELSQYPPEFIKKVKLKRIIVCKKLGWGKQKRAAVPDFRRQDLYYDCEAGKDLKFYQRIVIHHEFYHTVDYSDDRLVYKDDAWKKLNARDFEYGNGGASVQGDGSQFRYRNPTNGFITKYSTSGVEEDKAETFAHMMVNPRHVTRAAKKDARLDTKVTRMKRLLRDMSKSMNDEFWNLVAKRQK